MTLDEYMRKHELSDAEMGARLGGIHRTTVSKVRRGIIGPSARFLARIAEATDGQVTANDFFPPSRAIA